MRYEGRVWIRDSRFRLRWLRGKAAKGGGGMIGMSTFSRLMLLSSLAVSSARLVSFRCRGKLKSSLFSLPVSYQKNASKR